MASPKEPTTEELKKTLDKAVLKDLEEYKRKKQEEDQAEYEQFLIDQQEQLEKLAFLEAQENNNQETLFKTTIEIEEIKDEDITTEINTFTTFKTVEEYEQYYLDQYNEEIKTKNKQIDKYINKLDQIINANKKLLLNFWDDDDNIQKPIKQESNNIGNSIIIEQTIKQESKKLVKQESNNIVDSVIADTLKFDSDNCQKLASAYKEQTKSPVKFELYDDTCTKLANAYDKIKQLQDKLKDFNKYKEFYDSNNKTNDLQEWFKANYTITNDRKDKIKNNDMYTEFLKVNSKYSIKQFKKVIEDLNIGTTTYNGSNCFVGIKPSIEILKQVINETNIFSL